MSNSNRVLYANTNVAANESGSWYSIRPDGQSHRAVNIEITGTVTVTLVGRCDGGDAGNTVKQVTASELFQIAHCPQLQVRLTGVTAGASVRVSVDGACLLAA